MAGGRACAGDTSWFYRKRRRARLLSPVHGVPPPGPGCRAGAAARRRAGRRAGAGRRARAAGRRGEAGRCPSYSSRTMNRRRPGRSRRPAARCQSPHPRPLASLVPAGGREPSPGAGLARVAGGGLPSRYAGAMLAHAYLDRIGAEAILAAALPPALARPRYDDLGAADRHVAGVRAGRLLRRGHQAPDPGPGRDPRRDRPAPRPAHAAAPARRDRRPVRPAGPAAAAGHGDARRRRPRPARVLRR